MPAPLGGDSDFTSSSSPPRWRAKNMPGSPVTTLDIDLRYTITMEDSIFTKIIRGDIPSHKIYEDELTYAFLDIHPVTPGHTLVIPKRQVEFLWDLDDGDYQAVMASAKKIALRLREILDVPYVGEQVIGVDVPHAHVHLIPFTDAAEFHRQPDMSAEPNHVALAALAEKLRF